MLWDGMLCILFYFYFFGCAAYHVESQFPNQESSLYPVHWKHKILTTGQPGKSNVVYFKWNSQERPAARTQGVGSGWGYAGEKEQQGPCPKQACSGISKEASITGHVWMRERAVRGEGGGVGDAGQWEKSWSNLGFYGEWDEKPLQSTAQRGGIIWLTCKRFSLASLEAGSHSNVAAA